MLDEAETVLSILEQLHAEMIAIAEEVGPQGMNWSPRTGFNSIYAIATHAAGSQLWWIKENMAGVVVERDRASEFSASGESPARLLDQFRSAQAVTRDILDAVTSDDMRALRDVRGRSVTIRWILLHVIEHTATHLGHMQITKQLYERREQSG